MCIMLFNNSILNIKLIMEINIMKKQIIAAAVAASVSAVAMADISITGDAKYEYFYTDTSANTSTNTANTEMHINIAGKKGDTSVVINTEIDASGTDGAGLDIEDNYLTTKIGDISVKAGNYASSTSGILGEIDEGGRVRNKVTLSTTVGGMTLYAGNGTNTVEDAAITDQDDKTNIADDMFAGAQLNVGGVAVELKKVDAKTSAIGAKGSIGGVTYRVEQKNSDTSNSDVMFAEVGTTIGGMGVSYAMIDADAKNLVGETDSAIFAKEMGNSSVKAEATGTQQLTIKTSVEGNSVTAKMGVIDDAYGVNKDQEWTQLIVSRPLASGATATVTWTDADTSATADATTLELDLSVSF